MDHLARAVEVAIGLWIAQETEFRLAVWIPLNQPIEKPPSFLLGNIDDGTLTLVLKW